MNMYSKEYFYNYIYISNKAAEEIAEGITKDNLSKFVFSYGRALITICEIDDLESAKAFHESFETWKQAACMLTYRELFTIYPIEKDFDGYKYEMKDYWSTKEYIEENIKNLDDFINEDTLIELMMEYDNNDLFRIAMRYIEIVEFFHRQKYGFSVLDEFLDSVGVSEIPRDSQGNLIGIVDGKVVKKHKEDTFIEMGKKEKSKLRIIK